MKRLAKIAVWFGVATIALGIGTYCVLTNAKLQKHFVQKQLPQGATVEEVRIRYSSAELSGFKYQNTKGDLAGFDTLKAEFNLYALLFKKELHLKNVAMHGAYLKPQNTEKQSATEMRRTLFDTLDLLESLDRPISTNSIRVEGHYEHPTSSIPFILEIGPSSPGASSTARLNLDSLPASHFPKPIETAEASISFEFEQTKLGGIAISGLTAKFKVLSSAASIPLFEGTLSSSMTRQTTPNSLLLASTIHLECPSPELFHQTPIPPGPIAAEASFTLEASMEFTKISELQAEVSNRDGTTIALDWLQSVNPVQPQPAAGHLANITLSKLSTKQINQWIGRGISIDTPPITTQARLNLNDLGQYTLALATPLSVQPLSINHEGKTHFENTKLEFGGTLTYRFNETLNFEVEALSLEDANGAPILEASARGAITEEIDPRSKSRFKAKANYTLHLATLAKQPHFPLAQNLLTGKLEGTAEMDPARDFPYYTKGTIDQLKTPDQYRNPTYSWQAHFKHRKDSFRDYFVKVQAGSKRTPTSSLEIRGTIKDEAKPTYFMPSIRGERFTLSDFTSLTAALTATAQISDKAVRTKPTLPGMAPTPKAAPTKPTQALTTKPPFWNHLTGTSSIKIDTVELSPQAIFENVQTAIKAEDGQLSASLFSAQTAGGLISGDGSIQYTDTVAQPYSLKLKGAFKNVNPAYFATRAKRIPIEGKFSGALQLTGAGRSIESAFDSAYGSLQITSTEGLITAFDLNNRRQLGLAGAELAGLGLSNVLGNDSINEKTQAFINALPYFREIPYDSCTLEISRDTDKAIQIDKLSIYSSYLRIDGSGQIDTETLGEVGDAPLDLQLDLKSKGPFADDLNTLNLLGSETDEAGFIAWKQSIPISGNLESPDTSKLTKLFYESAKDSIESGSGETGDRIRNELESGLQLFNQILDK